MLRRLARRQGPGGLTGGQHGQHHPQGQTAGDGQHPEPEQPGDATPGEPPAHDRHLDANEAQGPDPQRPENGGGADERFGYSRSNTAGATITGRTHWLDFDPSAGRVAAGDSYGDRKGVHRSGDSDRRSEFLSGLAIYG
jgi:hypothetical protein